MRGLARLHGISGEQGSIDVFAHAASRFADAEVDFEHVENRLFVLTRRGVVTDQDRPHALRHLPPPESLMPFDPSGDHDTRGYVRNFAGEKDPARITRIEQHASAAISLTALTSAPDPVQDSS